MTFELVPYRTTIRRVTTGLRYELLEKINKTIKMYVGVNMKVYLI